MSTTTHAPQALRPAAQARPTRPVRAPHSAGPVRLTRRGRLVFLVLALGLVLAAGMWLGQAATADADGGAPAPTRVVTVAPGETLWGLAEETVAATGGGDVRSVVDEIQDLNDLDSGVLQAGQELRVPLG